MPDATPAAAVASTPAATAAAAPAASAAPAAPVTAPATVPDPAQVVAEDDGTVKQGGLIKFRAATDSVPGGWLKAAAGDVTTADYPTLAMALEPFEPLAEGTHEAVVKHVVVSQFTNGADTRVMSDAEAKRYVAAWADGTIHRQIMGNGLKVRRDADGLLVHDFTA